jgi:hypothetical protein
VDIRRFFDALDHVHLREILHQRVRDGVLLRLIGKWLKAGVLESGSISYLDSGTPQGGVISPLLANVYLHEVLDTWIEERVAPQLRGPVRLIRYADDCGGERVGQGGARLHQVWSGKANVSEPLMTCRKRRDAVETRVQSLPWDEAWGTPVSCPGDGRHEGGASPDQALVRNVGTYRSDTKGEPASGRPTRGRVPIRSGGADRCVVALRPSNAGGAKASACPAEGASQLERGGARG